MARRRRTPQVRLSFLSGPRSGEDPVELIPGRHALGSARRNKVHLADEALAKQHARLHVSQGQVELEELGETPRVEVNGAALQGKVALATGDEIQLGQSRLKVELLEAAPAPAQAEPPPPPPGSAAERRAARQAEQEAARAVRGAGSKPEGAGQRRGQARALQAFDPDNPPRFGMDHTAVLLAGFFRTRPDMPFDHELLEKHRTHGYYHGDGNGQRRLFVGWEPLHVLYVMPRFVQLGEGWPPYDGRGKFRDPGPHPQPDVYDEGFVVEADYNQAGVYYSYVVFADRPYQPGKPIDGGTQKGPVS